LTRKYPIDIIGIQLVAPALYRMATFWNRWDYSKSQCFLESQESTFCSDNMGLAGLASWKSPDIFQALCMRAKACISVPYLVFAQIRLIVCWKLFSAGGFYQVQISMKYIR